MDNMRLNSFPPSPLPSQGRPSTRLFGFRHFFYARGDMIRGSQGLASVQAHCNDDVFGPDMPVTRQDET